jgi:Fe-S oxidoreductase
MRSMLRRAEQKAAEMPDLSTSLSYCTFCPKLCRHTCPVSNATSDETLVPRDKMARMRQLLTGQLESTAEESEPLYGCTGCGACTSFCHHSIEVGPALFHGRAQAQDRRAGHPALEQFAERFTAEARASAARARALIINKGSPAKTAVLPSCEAPELAFKVVALATVGGDEAAVFVPEQACGGYPLYATGEHDAFRLYAERLGAELSRFERVVLHCPACTWLLRTEYPRFGVPLSCVVQHTSEYLSPFAERLSPRNPPSEAYYHDPCHLGRQLGVYEAPRRLAARAVQQLREFSRSHDQAECSGGGGLLPLTMPDVAAAIATRRLEEVEEAGVATVITACSTCKRQLARNGVKTLDLLDLF